MRLGDPLAGGPPRSTTRQCDGPCSVEGCTRRGKARGLCGTHYRRVWLHGDVEADNRRKQQGCSVDGCKAAHVAKGYCQSHYRKLRLYGSPTGTHPNARNGRPQTRRITSEGYVVYYWPEHPNARKDGKIAEHTVVMSEKIGRPLRALENVHHKNGQRSDNRPENLELWRRMQPTGQRVTDLIEFAKEVLSEYGEDPSPYA